MSDSFVEYFDTFKELRGEASGLLKKACTLSGDRKNDLLQDVRNKVEELERYYRILEQEAKGGNAQEKRKMQSQLRVCQGDIEKLKSSVEKETLLGQAKPPPGPRTVQEQAAAYQATMDRTTNHLTDAKKTIGEIDDIAINVDTNLAMQREQLERAQNNVTEARADVQDAKGHLSSLARKAFSNIILLWIIILALIADFLESFGDACYEAIALIKKMATADMNQQRQVEYDIQKCLDEAQRYFRMMQQEATGGDAQLSKFEKIVSDFERAKLLSNTPNRNAPTNDNFSMPPSDRHQQQLDRIGGRLHDVQITIAQSREYAVNTTNNLVAQGDQLRSAHNNVIQTRANVKEAASHLASLKRKNFIKIIILWLIIFGLSIAILYKILDFSAVMTESFQEYYETFKELRTEAMGIIKEMPGAPAGRRDQLERDARNRIEEVERYLRILEQEAKGGDAQMKRKMQTQIRSCQSDLEKLNNNLVKALLLGNAAQRQPAPVANSSGNGNAQAYQDRLDRTGGYLNEAKNIIGETQAVGINIDNNLMNAREQLERAHENVKDTRADAQEAAGHLASLRRKNMVTIILMWVVIFGLCVAILYRILKMTMVIK
ncbi:hypothetical protein THRCLA_00990 [Thraustotheca clavata]|uniref:t-SNARE coiled-coil homology domain-containing protein n=1 Tax=Thraustotheca clavata TaxID=74557 RepID=A0A1W0A9Y3_9STRA|nr:hypothetical protein THRCLA_00990 [Thraustotheca clavata]